VALRKETRRVFQQLAKAYDSFATSMQEDTPENRLIKGNRVEKAYVEFQRRFMNVAGPHGTPYMHQGVKHYKKRILLHGDFMWGQGQSLEHALKVDKTALGNHTNHQLVNEHHKVGRMMQASLLTLLAMPFLFPWIPAPENCHLGNPCFDWSILWWEACLQQEILVSQHERRTFEPTMVSGQVLLDANPLQTTPALTSR
jgi:hypothetical protein